MLRLVVSSQKGGVGKTTTVANLGHFFADHGFKVLLIDTDPQGQLGTLVGADPAPESYLVNFIMYSRSFRDCLTRVADNIDILCSNRDTQKTEAHLSNQIARELAFETMLGQVDHPYDVVLIDTQPSINMIQACAMLYAKRILFPVTMDTLSFQGIAAACQTAKSLNNFFNRDVRPVAILPVAVNQSLQMTELVMEAVRAMSQSESIPLLSPIRTDAVVPKAIRARKFLAEYDPTSKAAEDYATAGGELLNLMKDQLDARQLELAVKTAT